MSRSAAARAWAWAAVALGAAGLVLTIAYGLSTLLNVARDIDDCLSAKGVCQRLADKRSEEQQALTIRMNVATIICVRQDPTIDTSAELLACVEERLREDPALRRLPPPSDGLDN